MTCMLVPDDASLKSQQRRKILLEQESLDDHLQRQARSCASADLPGTDTALQAAQNCLRQPPDKFHQREIPYCQGVIEPKVL